MAGRRRASSTLIPLRLLRPLCLASALQSEELVDRRDAVRRKLYGRVGPDEASDDSVEELDVALVSAGTL